VPYQSRRVHKQYKRACETYKTCESCEAFVSLACLACVTQRCAQAPFMVEIFMTFKALKCPFTCDRMIHLFLRIIRFKDDITHFTFEIPLSFIWYLMTLQNHLYFWTLCHKTGEVREGLASNARHFFSFFLFFFFFLFYNNYHKSLKIALFFRHDKSSSASQQMVRCCKNFQS